MSDYDVPRPMADFFAKLEDLDVYTHQVTQQWPRGERFALTARVREQMTQIQRLSMVAWKRKSKAGVLFDIDVEVAVLRMLVRKAYRLHYINARRLEVWSRHLAEIGRMVGAWIKHEQARAKGGGL